MENNSNLPCMSNPLAPCPCISGDPPCTGGAATTVRRLVAEEDINWGEGTFADSVGRELHKVNAGSIPFAQDTERDVGELYSLLDLPVQDFQDHIEDTDVHGATSAATPSRIASRDDSGRMKVADGVASDDVATVGQVEEKIEAAIAEIDDDGNSGDSEALQEHIASTTAHGATSSATPSRIVSRDASGRMKAADGVATDDVATIGQVDTKIEAALEGFEGGGSGGVTDHGALTGLSDDDHPQYVSHDLATAEGDFLVASGAGVFEAMPLSEVQALVGGGAPEPGGIFNGSFELDSDNDGIPDGWEFYQSGGSLGSASIVTGADNSVHGKNGVNIIAPHGHFYSAKTADWIPLNKKVPVSISYWLKSDVALGQTIPYPPNATQTAVLVIIHYISADGGARTGTYVEHRNPDHIAGFKPLSNVWARYQATFPLAPSDAVFFKIEFQVRNTGPVGAFVEQVERLQPLATAATSTTPGLPGVVALAAGNDTTSWDKAATPAGVAAQIEAGGENALRLNDILINGSFELGPNSSPSTVFDGWTIVSGGMTRQSSSTVHGLYRLVVNSVQLVVNQLNKITSNLMYCVPGSIRQISFWHKIYNLSLGKAISKCMADWFDAYGNLITTTTVMDIDVNPYTESASAGWQNFRFFVTAPAGAVSYRISFVYEVDNANIAGEWDLVTVVGEPKIVMSGAFIARGANPPELCRNSYNVESVTRIGPGNYKITPIVLFPTVYGQLQLTGMRDHRFVSQSPAGTLASIGYITVQSYPYNGSISADAADGTTCNFTVVISGGEDSGNPFS